MPSIRHFSIVFDRPQPVFMPGESITGRAILALDEPLVVDGILLEFRGEARVAWHDNEYSGRETKGETRTYMGNGGGLTTGYYRAARDYVNANMQVFGKGQLIPNAGDYVWPFRFQLPVGIPSSFESGHGSIRYFIKSVVQKSAVLSVNDRKKTFFSVVGLEDCNLPKYRIPLQLEDQRHTCCWCCASDPIRMEVRVDRSAYTPLDKIAIYGSFDNRSTRELEPRAMLIQTVIYRGRRGFFSDPSEQFDPNSYTHTRVAQHTICEIRGKSIPPRSSDVWSPAFMQIPIVAPTINSCDILMVQYHLKVSLHVPMGADLQGLFPITIGTIPYRGPPAVGFGAAAPTVGALSGQYDSTASVMTDTTPHQPSPAYEAGRMPVDNQRPPSPNAPLPQKNEEEELTSPSAPPPAYWELFPRPPEPETEEA